jgi:hypothetical protein
MRWGESVPTTPPTYTALAGWSWVDLARHLLCGLAGGGAAAVLGALLAPDLALVRTPALRVAGHILTVLLWMLPLTGGLCLLEGQPARAVTPWLRALGRALRFATAGGIALGMLLAFLPADGIWAAVSRYTTWVGVCAFASLACWEAFPHTRHRLQTAVAGVLAGVAMGWLAQQVVPLTATLPGLIGHIARQFGLLLPAGVLFGFTQGFVREVAKAEWLLVVYGDHPGRLYPLYGTPLTLGTAADNLLVVDAAGGVLPHHVVIHPGSKEAQISGCVEGALVFLRDRRISVSELCDGDEIQIGETVLRYYRIQ